MELESLIYKGLIWNAAESNQIAGSSIVTPETIISQGYYHEFFLQDSGKLSVNNPVSVLLPLLSKLESSTLTHDIQNQFVVFLGKDVWPTPFCIRDSFNDKLNLSNFLFIDPSSENKRRRALEILAGSSNVLAVITSLPRIPFPFTQKLHLASKHSFAYVFVFRPYKDLQEKSAAFSRWIVNPTVSNTDFPSWNISLQHSKGMSIKERIWLMEGKNEKEVSMHLLSELVSGSHSEELASTRCA